MVSDADLATDEPFCLEPDFGLPAFFEVGRKMKRDKQDNVILIAVIGKRRAFQFLRKRPLNFASFESGRKLPFEYRRQTRVAGINPVDMPVLLQRKMHAKPSLAVGAELRRKQFDSSMAGLDGFSRRSQQARRNKTEKNP